MGSVAPFVITDPKDPYYGCAIPMKFEELGAKRRAALRLLPNIEDPEAKNPIHLSKLKSSRQYIIDHEKSTATLEGGYRLCRCSRSFIHWGKYYWELIFLSSELNLLILKMKILIESLSVKDEDGLFR